MLKIFGLEICRLAKFLAGLLMQGKSSSLKGPQAVASHLVVVARHNFTLTCIPVSQTLYKCFFIDIGLDHLYVGLAPQKTESD